MTSKTNKMEIMNTEVQTEEQENGTVIAVPIEETINDNTVQDDNFYEGIAPETESEATENSEEAEETEQDVEAVEDAESTANSKMSMKERIILIITAIILLLLLIFGAVTLYNGIYRAGENAQKEDTYIPTDSITVSDNENTSKDSDNSIISDTKAENGKNNGEHVVPDNRNSSVDNHGQKPTDNGTNKSDKESEKTNPVPTETNPSSTPADTTSNNEEKNKDETKPVKSDNEYPEYVGETKVYIAKVNDDTGIVTITIDGKSVLVPVQTTLFNGRITKTGVAQAKLFGYNIGATVLLYYPKTEGFHYGEANGYMSRTDEGLTVLVDINGEDSKLLIKLNGLKSLF